MAIGGLTLAGCSSDGGGGDAGDGPNLDALGVSEEVGAQLTELYDDAIESGETDVMIYAGHHDEFIPVYEAFERAFPALSVERGTYAGAELQATLEAERETGNHLGSLVVNPNVDRYAEQGFGQPYEPITFKVDPEIAENVASDQLAGPEDMYYAGWAFMFNLSYNTDIVDEGELPATWADIANPEWAGDVTFMNPISPGGTQGVITQLLLGDVISEEDLEGIADNAQALATDQLSLQALSGGEFALQPFAAATSVLLAAESGAPVESYFFDENNVILTQKWMLAADAPAPDAAKVFLNYLHTVEAQQLIMDAGNFPLYQDESLESPYGWPPLAEVNFLPLKAQSELRPAAADYAPLYESIFGD